MSILPNICRHCNSTNTIECILPSGVHYAKLECHDCGRFIKWLPKPVVHEVCITKLLSSANLETWERQFLKIIAFRNPSKAEAIVVEAIHAKVNHARCDRGSE
jgi:hypothetical protein